MDDLPHILQEFFSRVPTLSLATVDDAGMPHAANVNFAADDRLDLYFISNPKAAHSRHIARCDRVAATAYAAFTGPEEIHGVQLRGLCHPITPEEFGLVHELFVKRFPYAAAMEERIRAEQFYRLRPTWLRWIDNRRRFGFKVETDWPVVGL